MTQVSYRSYVEDKLSKNHFASPYWETIKISPPKLEKPKYNTGQSSTIMQIFTLISVRYLFPGKNTHFSLIGTPLGATVPCCTFLESSRQLILNSIDITLLRTVFSRYSRSKFGILGPLGVPPPKGETLCPEPICTIIQNFTPIKLAESRR